jgi:hypothetical protein
MASAQRLKYRFKTIDEHMRTLRAGDPAIDSFERTAPRNYVVRGVDWTSYSFASGRCKALSRRSVRALSVPGALRVVTHGP